MAEADLRVEDESAIRGIAALVEDRARAAPVLADLRAGRLAWPSLNKDVQQALAGAPLLDLLLDLSREERYNDPERMAFWARAACTIAEGLDLDRYGRALCADLQARAWAELGNAYRVAEDYRNARHALNRAGSLAKEGTQSTALLARISELLAIYHSDLGEFAKATSLLELAKELYSTAGDSEGIDRSLLRLALTIGYDNDCYRSIIVFLQLLNRLPPSSSLELPAIHGLALNLVEGGLYEWAKDVVQRNLRLYRRSGRLNTFRLLWLEGKIAIGLQDYGRAEAKLNNARFGFARKGKTYDAALVTLDLAWVHAKEGRRREVAWLAGQMLQTFRVLGIARESIASLVLLKKSCEEERPVEVLCGQIETLAKLLPSLSRGRRAAPRKA